MQYRIRDAYPTDVETLAAANAAMALETEQKALDAQTVRLGVAAALNDPAHGRYFVAESGSGAIVGQLMVTFEWSDWRNGQFWWIQSVYVDPPQRRKGVFKALYEHVERLARSTPGVCGLRLYVETENETAQRTYQRCGMVDAGYRVMEVDYTSSGATPPEGD